MTLKNPEFAKITENNASFYGCNQSWFLDKFSVNGGCGVAAAANILAYLSASDEKYKALYPYGSLEKSEFLKFMEELCGYVKIRNFFGLPLGVWGKKRLEKGVLSYAKKRGVKLSAVKFGGSVSFSNAESYIKTALSKNLPIAMLIGFNKRLKSVEYEYPDKSTRSHSFERHWVTITEICERNGKTSLKVSSWGAFAYIDLRDFIDGEKVYSALVYFK